jgi:hypothetical protein
MTMEKMVFLLSKPPYQFLNHHILKWEGHDNDYGHITYMEDFTFNWSKWVEVKCFLRTNVFQYIGIKCINVQRLLNWLCAKTLALNISTTLPHDNHNFWFGEEALIILT